jgi:hypothetical protein
VSMDAATWRVESHLKRSCNALGNFRLVLLTTKLRNDALLLTLNPKP